MLRFGRILPPVVAAVIVLGAWETLVAVFDVEEFLLPRPSVIFSTLVDELAVVGAAGLFTLREVLGGLAAGVVFGVGLAMVTARYANVSRAMLPIAIAVNAAPIVALAPISNIWFGITNPVSKMAVVAVIVFFPVLINATRGLTEVDPAQLELMRSYASSDRQMVREVRLPNALPYLFSALRVAASLSVIAAIVTEYFGGSREALGVYISQQAALFRFAEAWAAIVVANVIGLGLYGAVLLLERLVMPWHHSFRAT